MKTSVSLLTAPAPGAIAVIAVVGPRAEAIAARVLRHRRSDAPAVLSRDRPTVCRLMDGEVVLDDAVAARFGDGERTVIEICVHGGVRVVQRAMWRLRKAGAEVAPAPDAAIRTGTDNVVEQQIDTALIRAEGRRWVHWLLAQRAVLPGYLQGLADGAAVSPEEREGFLRRSRAASGVARGLHIALLGPPNAGKSTLANRLIGGDRVVTSATPGTTRDWVDEHALIGGWPVILTDTAGLRPTECPIEREAIHRGLGRVARADVVLLVVDGAAERDDAIERTVARLAQSLPNDARAIVVVNKSDLPRPPGETGPGRMARSEIGGAESTVDARIAGLPVVRVSARTGEGIDRLERLAEEMLDLTLLAGNEPAAFLPEQAPTLLSVGL